MEHHDLTATESVFMFRQAAQQWLESKSFHPINPSKHARYVSPRTFQDYEQYVQMLNRFFGELPVAAISSAHLRQYQQHRTATAGANKINQEMGVLVRILRRAGAWTSELDQFYQPLAYVEPDIPRAMTPEEQQRFLMTAATRPRWEIVYRYALLALHTTLSNCEVRGLRVADIDLVSQVLYVRREHAKNRHRIRTVPLTAEARWAAEQLLERARCLASSPVLPEHYLMPFRVARDRFDLFRPMSNSGLKKPFNEVRRAAGLPGLRIHDLRHSAITRLCEAGTPVTVIMSMAGHISERMRQHYTQISDQAKRRALECAARGGSYFDAPPRPRSDTRDSTGFLVR